MKTVSFVRRKFNAMHGVATVAVAVNFTVMLFVSLEKPDFVRLVVRDDGIAMETPFRGKISNIPLDFRVCGVVNFCSARGSRNV